MIVCTHGFVRVVLFKFGVCRPDWKQFQVELCSHDDGHMNGRPGSVKMLKHVSSDGIWSAHSPSVVLQGANSDAEFVIGGGGGGGGGLGGGGATRDDKPLATCWWGRKVMYLPLSAHGLT